MRSTLSLVLGALRRWRRVSGLGLEALVCSSTCGMPVSTSWAPTPGGPPWSGTSEPAAAQTLDASSKAHISGEAPGPRSRRCSERRLPLHPLVALNIRCGGMVRHLAHFATPGRQLATAYKAAAKRVHTAPWMAFAPAVPHGVDLHSSCGVVLRGAVGRDRAERRPRARVAVLRRGPQQGLRRPRGERMSAIVAVLARKTTMTGRPSDLASALMWFAITVLPFWGAVRRSPGFRRAASGHRRFAE